MTEAEAEFENVKRLFWAQLDGTQRVRCLVAAGVAPETATRPIPQTFESVMLRQIWAEGKAADFWDAMTPYLPEHYQRPNPFAAAAPAE
jgi:hypothetical protein